VADSVQLVSGSELICGNVSFRNDLIGAIDVIRRNTFVRSTLKVGFATVHETCATAVLPTLP
jgi:hypothetical protein